MRAVEGTVVLLIVLFLPNIPPFCKFETPYKVSSTLPLEGKLAVNDKLSEVKFWHKDNIHGPETFASFNGELYTSLQSGEIVKLTGEQHMSPIVKFGKACKYFEEEVCGRPLGMEFDKSGALFAADAYYGIYKVDVKTGTKVQLVSPEVEINGKKPKLFNSIAVASTGEIYWTDSSTEFALKDGVFDLLADGSGRVIKYDPKTKRNTVLIDQLHFPNGLLLSKAEDYLIVSVTNRNALLKYHLKGTKAGQQEVLIDGLPGMPDNINSDGHGGILVPLVTSHDSSFPNPIQIFGPFPWMRKLIGRGLGLLEFGFRMVDTVYPNDLAKIGMHLVGHFSLPTQLLRLSSRTTIVHVSETGELLGSFHTTNGQVFAISEAFIHKDELLLGSPFNEYIGRIPLSKLGLKPLPVAPKVQPTQAPKPTTTQAPKTTTTRPPTTTTTPPPTTTKKPEQKREVPKQDAPKPTQAPKVTTTTPKPTPKATQAPKATPKPTEAKPAPTVASKQQQQAPKTTTKSAEAPSQNNKL